jgi:hypothetical protein
VEPGDAIVLSGPIGDHGITILTRRLDLDFGPDLASDTAPLHEVAALVLAACPDTHAMRDPTRGGLAASLNEIAARRRVGMIIDESAVPVSDTTRGAAEILGLDPFTNEGARRVRALRSCGRRRGPSHASARRGADRHRDERTRDSSPCGARQRAFSTFPFRSSAPHLLR